MKNIYLIITLFIGIQSTLAFDGRVKKSINLDWRFSLDANVNAQDKNFDDSQWRQLNVPHDWSIEGEFLESNASGTSGAFLPGGIGWYRKEINIDKLSKEEEYEIHFDGVYLNSDVWINGHHLGFHPNGYIGFSYNLTEHLVEGKNVIAVKVDHSKLPSGRWYTGSGIYRNVWLERHHKLHVLPNELLITTPEVSNEKAVVNVSTAIKNTWGKKKNIEVNFQIVDPKGKVVGNYDQKLKVVDQNEIQHQLELENPFLWSTDAPNIYYLNIAIKENKQLIDTYSTHFGIRKLDWIPQKGLFLNDQPILLKGLSNHQDAGPVGVAVPEQVLYRRLKMLKDMGCNALRTAHHPFAPEFYTMCDTMGFMVMDEAFDGWWKNKADYDYGIYFEKYWKKDLENFVKRDRNHPSVVIWSIGNEVPKFTNDEQESIVNELKKHDTSRPVTQGRGYLGTHIDLAGFNGHGELKNVIENYHKKDPNKLIIGTEITHTLQTRGVYRTKTWYRTKDNPAPWEKPEHFKRIEPRVYKIKDLSEEEVFTGITSKYQSSYDNSIVRIGVRHEWNRVEALDYYIGNFRWTGFDYLGESFNWPARTANFGIIDLAGFPKDHYYLYQSLWSDVPMVHILPHWSHKGKEGVKIPVVVYTNGDAAELFLNGKSLGKKEMTSERQIVWQVPYTKGKVEAIAYKEGKEWSKQIIQTAEEAYTMKLTSDRKRINADKKDVLHCEINVVDAEGNIVPNAMDEVTIEVSGAGKIIGIENGDILDMSSSKYDLTRKVFNGKCLLIIQSNGKTGDINIKVTSKTLKEADLRIGTHAL
ncbi:sugar-binding domain-containing protein [Flammeovirga pacifica]|uniref:Beta-galactosidase n=1 Tax=Flammeovirga pacifica TaxID=915059 RepID=A0A1S1YUI1_FLAPC|nr:sugar-binding domain-containing protein [Flammeovirga pacifica]OHX64671.1 hypothetical protein NH26_24190 [Flammeovirga pacifica]